ncbi:MAG TPA: hypothetical protein VHY91_04720 [Pirellulales bacterium]|jgi:hypothetical protein|nr:hypothetical protein [Pirellulales bacterium]
MADSTLYAPLRSGVSARRKLIIGTAIAMVACIVPINVLAPHFQSSILYAIPLTLLGCCGQLRALRWVTAVVIGLTVITYFVGFWLTPPATGPQFLSFRLVNRAMVAGMLWLMSKVLSMWFEAEHGLHHEPDRLHHRVSPMFGMLLAMPTVIAVALLDGLTPGHFNLAVLYLVPLVTCLFARSERLLWALFVLLQALAIGGLYWGPQPYSEEAFQRALQNRALNAVMMLIVTGLLVFWLRSSGERTASES